MYTVKDFIKYCKEGNIEGVKWCLGQKSKLNKKGFIWACRYGYIEILKLLINDDKFDVNIKERDEFLSAVDKDRIDTLKSLGLDCKSTYKGQCGLEIAYGKKDVVKLLLSSYKTNLENDLEEQMCIKKYKIKNLVSMNNMDYKLI